MENFSEFENNNVPQKSTGEIISHAFDLYKGVFLYALLATLVYLAGSFVLQTFSGFDSWALVEDVRSGDSDIDFWAIPGLRLYYGLSGLLGMLLAPLYVGFIYVTNKYHFQQKIEFSDLFIGYRQNFLNIVIYALLSSIIVGISFSLCLLPGFFVLPFFMLGYPILLFENATATEAISKSFNIAKENYGTFLGTSILALLISLSGIFLCFIGIVFTVMFMRVAMYSLYCAYCGKPKQLEFKS
ncbi:beta-carotene 15,15'-monooxygenase [Chryseobacterium sp.]|uniref:beta-carotene 15,15'-monooxygenase n=1 Tax=Chryseobacterium sp. TaxID=1871047 RepID=UPI0011CB6787|nr:beta-carotene 15,15'-monooxygenase [Chryseobacterium sp.]TXF75946.1 beta-carotene 15,15'-monooxygenase [Chryseobacterium sp.]